MRTGICKRNIYLNSATESVTQLRSDGRENWRRETLFFQSLFPPYRMAHKMFLFSFVQDMYFQSNFPRPQPSIFDPTSSVSAILLMSDCFCLCAPGCFDLTPLTGHRLTWCVLELETERRAWKNKLKSIIHFNNHMIMMLDSSPYVLVNVWAVIQTFINAAKRKLLPTEQLSTHRSIRPAVQPSIRLVGRAGQNSGSIWLVVTFQARFLFRLTFI